MSDNKQRNCNRLALLIIVGVGVLPMLMAWLTHQFPEWVPDHGNNGNLVVPVKPLEYEVFRGADEFSREHSDEMKGHWVLLQPVTREGCQQVCQEALYKTRQLVLMLNKDLTRVRRVLLFPEAAAAKATEIAWDDDKALLRMQAAPDLLQTLQQSVGSELQDGMLLMVDPLGNLMMWYPADFDPYAVRKDLKRLLKVSQIG